MKDLNLIKLTDLEKRYGKKEALTGINLTIGRGKIIGLLGPNGSGKTTLIKLLNGLLQPTSGEIKVNGKAPGVDSKKIISYLPDKMYFADWMKIADLMDFFEDFYEDFDRKKAEGMCESPVSFGNVPKSTTLSARRTDRRSRSRSKGFYLRYDLKQL